MVPDFSILTPDEVLRRVPLLRFQNARGAHIFIRPSVEHRYTLPGDLTVAATIRLSLEGYEPAAVVETSPANF